MIVHIYRGEVRDIFEQIQTVDEAIRIMPKDMVFMDAPRYVGLGWTWDGSEWHKPFQSGLEYDVKDKCFYSHGEYRRILHERTTNDTMEAMRKIREGDMSYDWEGWLKKLDAYNLAIEETKNQDEPAYPEYPQRG